MSVELQKPAYRKKLRKDEKNRRILCAAILVPVLAALVLTLTSSKQFISLVKDVTGLEKGKVKKGKSKRKTKEEDFEKKKTAVYDSFWTLNSTQLEEEVLAEPRTVQNGILSMMYLPDCVFCTRLAIQLKYHFVIQHGIMFDEGRNNSVKRGEVKFGNVSLALMPATNMSKDFVDEYQPKHFPDIRLWINQDEEGERVIEDIPYSGPPLYRDAPLRIFDWLQSQMELQKQNTTGNHYPELKRLPAVVKPRSKNEVTAQEPEAQEPAKVEAEAATTEAKKPADAEEKEFQERNEAPKREGEQAVEEKKAETAAAEVEKKEETPTAEGEKKAETPAAEGKSEPSKKEDDSNALTVTDDKAMEQLFDALEGAKLNAAGNARMLFFVTQEMADLIDELSKAEKLEFNMRNLRQHIVVEDKADNHDELCEENRKLAEEKAMRRAEVAAETAALVDEGEAPALEEKPESETTMEDTTGYDVCSKYSFSQLSVSVSDPDLSLMNRMSFKTKEDAQTFIENKLGRMQLPAVSRMYPESLREHFTTVPVAIVLNKKPEDKAVIAALERVHKALDFQLTTVFVDPTDSKVKDLNFEFDEKSKSMEAILFSLTKKEGKHTRFTGEPTELDDWVQWIMRQLSNPDFFKKKEEKIAQ